jgi:bifunctional hydroxylase/dehydrase
MLQEWALELGATICRGHRVAGLRQDHDGVIAVIEGPDGRRERTARYLVGCDGGHSTIRQLAGFEFLGTGASREMYLADVAGRRLRPRLIGERVPGGMVMNGPLEDDVDRIIVCAVSPPPPGPERNLNFAEVADVWERLTGESLHGAETRWVSTFTDATRQVTQYRKGRVLLAGDAAHIHLPAGGQGMSVGIQDAVNLGWKLAATINGWAPPGLLDTYHSERHPVGQRVLRNTRAQGELYLSGTAIEPLRSVMAELMTIPDVGRHLSGMVSGLDITYDVGLSGHPLLGRRMSDGDVELANGTRTRMAALMPQSRSKLLCTSQGSELSPLAADWADRVDIVEIRGLSVVGDGLDAITESVLIRPDGYVAWAAPGAGDVRKALERWLGPARIPV